MVGLHYLWIHPVELHKMEKCSCNEQSVQEHHETYLKSSIHSSETECNFLLSLSPIIIFTMSFVTGINNFLPVE